MYKILKLFKQDLSSQIGRFFYIYFFIQYLPGSVGIALRSGLFRRYLKSCGENLNIQEGVRVRNINNLSIGNNVALGPSNFIQAAGGVIIGDDVLFGPDVKIWSANHRFNDINKPIREQGYIDKKVVIGNNIWIGANAFIMPGANIGDGCIISAGSVVAGRKILPFTILAGNPARKIGTRKNKKNDIEKN
ncbi:MAG: acyltransferase [Bacteroidales bacterium]|nr:acyltransferase [Bacteroidales bacterium]